MSEFLCEQCRELIPAGATHGHTPDGGYYTIVYDGIDFDRETTLRAELAAATARAERAERWSRRWKRMSTALWHHIWDCHLWERDWYPMGEIREADDRVAKRRQEARQ